MNVVHNRNRKYRVINLDNVEILWKETTRNSTLNGLHKILFDLLDSCRKDMDPQYDPNNSKYDHTIKIDRIIELIISCKEGYEDTIDFQLSAIANNFSTSNGNTIIIFQTPVPDFGKANVEEQYYKIPDSTTKLPYYISNYGNVKNHRGEHVDQVYFDDGPRVYIPSDDQNDDGQYYSVPRLMVELFNPKSFMIKNPKMMEIQSNLDKIISSFERAGFENIDKFLKIPSEYSYIYTGSQIGEMLSININSKENH